MSAVRAAPPEQSTFALDQDPCPGVTYFHAATGEKLHVDLVEPAHVGKACSWCGGRGTASANAEGRTARAWSLAGSRAACKFCDGDGHAHGCVYCHHPIEEKRNDLPLMWPLQLFVAEFRRVGHVGESNELFSDGAAAA